MPFHDRERLRENQSRPCLKGHCTEVGVRLSSPRKPVRIGANLPRYFANSPLRYSSVSVSRSTSIELTTGTPPLNRIAAV